MLALLLAACGGAWNPQSFEEIHAGFPLDCAHAEAPCESCHDPSGPPAKLEDDACLACHEPDRPASHDPVETASCEECHSTCSWDSASPHPEGFDAPEAHGMTFKLQDPSEGDCRDCHGEALDGGEAQSCDGCHADEGIPDWRTDCVLCHGGENEPSGAPPVDIDDQAPISFEAHTAHVDENGDYRATPCRDCHLDHQDVMDPDHVFDLTPEVAEVDFSRGPSDQATWNGSTCANLYCHGSGQLHDGMVAASGSPMDCESCHPTEVGWPTMSGLHESHLDQNGIVCNDCHAAVIDAQGTIATPARHVDGTRDIAFFETTITSSNGGGTCEGDCHGYDHQQAGWGHPPGYDDPGLHGLDAKLQRSECRACHGADWDGGLAQSCDGCHTLEGHPDWRTDCTYCHGGQVDSSGAPPEDIDDQTDEALISFMGHPEHVGGGGLGHMAYDCDQCHTIPADAGDPGHMIDGTPGIAEVTLALGLSDQGGWDAATATCSNLYCHGDGRAPSGVITDSDAALGCDDCHATTTGFASLSGTHDAHMGQGVTCSECHSDVNASNTITDPAQHVDGDVDIDNAAAGRDPATGICTITCHNVDHQGYGWLGPHPPGYDAPEQHGAEALYWLQDCTSCHGADLLGGPSGVGCDSCHPANWRSDCSWCHGSDATGIPPTDVDGQTDEDLITFKAHPEHADGDIHPLWGCETCHGTAAGSYTDALTDPGHWIDGSAGVAEVSFTGIAAGTTYASSTCSNSVCHGDGQAPGSQADGIDALDCNGCHAYDVGVSDLSGTHATHLGVIGVTCADCHSPVVDATGTITQSNWHVNARVDFDATATGYDAVSDTCTVSCHGENHTGWGWNGGHPPGYDAPDIHGQEALFVQQDCRSCHGSDLLGGSSGQGCDSCHPPGWRSDCAFCHGSAPDGLPPEDLDNVTNEDLITFKAHPEHADGDTHPLWGCEECHGTASASYLDALTDPNHWFDGSPGRADVSFTGLGSGGTYSNGTCSGLYCHGDGRTDGSETDGVNGLSCTGCHGMPPNSNEHRDHDHDNYPCAECHALTVNTSDAIIGPNIHVDGTADVDMNAALNSVTWNGSTCSGSCHGEGHSNESW